MCQLSAVGNLTASILYMYILKESKIWSFVHDNVNACQDIHIEMLNMIAEFQLTMIVFASPQPFFLHLVITFVSIFKPYLKQ